MRRYHLAILGLSEMRWTGQGDFRTQTGEYLVYSGNDTHRRNGVGIILSPAARKSLLEFKPISDRIISIRLHAKLRKITIIQCYAPTEQDTDEQKDAFYDQLETCFMSSPKSDMKIIMGDFNAKLGQDNSNLQAIMGRHSLHAESNGNGNRLMDFCSAHQLFVGGTRFPHKDIHKYTWQSPDGVTRNQIDHILISRRFLSSLRDVKTVRDADIYSDH